jgi:peptide/nickel transport system permease protein
MLFIIVAGSIRTRLIASGFSFLLTTGLLLFASATKWFANPGLTINGVAVFILLFAGIASYISFGYSKSNLYKVGIVAAVFTVLYIPAQLLFKNPTPALVIIVLLGYILAGVVLGIILGGVDKRSFMRVFGIVGFLSFLITYFDRLLQAFGPYTRNPEIRAPIPTFGSQTPELQGNYWILTVDSITHLILPTLALLLMTFAGYTRYTRSSMLEVLGQDYIRTARAKGLPERSVIMRHAFKNAILPLATMVPLDIAAVLGGAIITEKIFGWYGMGSFFSNSLQHSDFNGVMGFLLVTASLAVFANIISDILNAFLDPRIRLNG